MANKICAKQGKPDSDAIEYPGPSCPECPPIPAEYETCDGNQEAEVSEAVQAYLAPGTVVYTRPCPDVVEYDKQVLCAPDGTKVIVVVGYDETGVPETSAYLFSGVAYGGNLDDLQDCQTDLESDQIEWCASGTDYTQWIVKEDGVPTGDVYWTDASGAVVAAPANPTRGSCALYCAPAVALGVLTSWG